MPDIPTPRITRIGLAMATNEELLDELKRRNVLKPCAGSMFVDGRAMAKLDDTAQEYLEVRLLEIMSRGLATAAPHDRVHAFSMEPASGDYPPGTVFARVDMLAIAVDAA